MGRAKWFYHPIAIFVFSIFALALSLFLYIYWYMAVSKGLESLVKRFNIDSRQVLEYETWVVILVLSLLVGIILLGIFTIFVYNRKIFQLYRLQHNFINNFTHELKTPVTSLKLYLETFKKYDISREDQLKYIEFMIHDVGRLSDNISRILNLSRLESKNYKGEFTKVDIVDFVERYYEKNSHFFRNCRIDIHAPENRYGFQYPINVSLFEMLLNNLITNALKYNISEEPKIDIRFEKQKNRIMIHFIDNGVGLEKKELRKIFKKFYQIGHSDNMSAKGSGLGLYFVQSIARIHQGKVVAVSEGKNKGSSFTLVLPAGKKNV